MYLRKKDAFAQYEYECLSGNASSFIKFQVNMDMNFVIITDVFSFCIFAMECLG
jgi:hypothetical protein